MFENQQLLHVRVPEPMLAELEEAARLLEEPSVTQIVRRAVREFLEGHEVDLERRRKREAERRRA
jgi:hypothetical protein